MMTREQLALKYGDEKVFVVKSSEYGDISDGVHPVSQYGLDFIQRLVEDGFFVLRKDAEYNHDYIQLIPYVLIMNEGRPFVAKRIGGDERLIGKLSLGMGGHINPEDQQEPKSISLYQHNIIRELSDEELHIDLGKTKSLTYKGIIRYTDPSDIISQDHLGLFYVLDTSDSEVSIKESDKLEGSFLPPEEVVSQVSSTESWSRLIVEHYLT